MNILIDAHMVGEHETGNETYIANLLKGLRSIDHPHRIVVAAAHDEPLFEELRADARFAIIPVSAAPVRRLLWDLPRAVRQNRIDLLHATYMAPPLCACPVVLSVHDVSFASHPEWFSGRDLAVLRLGVRSSIRRAVRVITISNHAKEEIIRFFRIPPERIVVTYLAADPFFCADAPRCSSDGSADKASVLIVGNLQPRKNLVRFIEAFARAHATLTPPPQLMICGKVQWQESEVYAAIESAGIESAVTFTGYVDNERLRSLYRTATVFAYPSLYEGFGLPILEAMACGAPVLTSNVASIPEVAGDAAVLMDPYDVEDMARKLIEMLGAPPLRTSLREKGANQVRQFSWERTARQTVDIYEGAWKGAQ
jgi:glycosyltransferase involved in cell wall biosynthesis